MIIMSKNAMYMFPFVLAFALMGVANGVEGLFGQYYEWSGTPPEEPWGVPVLERLDPTVDFNWGTGSPDPSISANNFAVRWSGEVVIPITGTYTFHTQSDDGIRLWVNNEQLIDNWTDHGNAHDDGTIELMGGQRYPIKLEFYENGGDALCELSWEGPGMSRDAIPSKNLWVGLERSSPSAPVPEDGEIIRSTWVTLEWMAGDFAASHTVYVGENYSDVEAGTGDTLRASQTNTSYALGFPGFPYPDGLVKGMTYYWRIEDVEADGVTTHTGPVWSFTVAPKTAYDPVPASGTEAVDPNVVLSWTPGFGGILHTVFFDEDYDTVNNAVAGIPQGTTTYKPGPLPLGKVFYWRVDEFLGTETVKGDVWFFSTAGTVNSPRPAYGAVNVRQDQILKWLPADNATSHQVYFGTDEVTVRSAGTGSVSKSLGDESYDPGMLQMGTTYYWRVDAVESTGTVKGPVWTFTTADYIVVDDFEDYTDDDAAGEAIWQAWIDGFGVDTNGSQVGYLMPPYAEQNTVHGGSQAMPLIFDIDMKYAEATLTLASPGNWAQGDTLKVWFHGSIVNPAAPLYVALNGNALVTHDDSKATQIHGWEEWDIPLQAFADLGVGLSNVNSVTVGVGDKTNLQASGSGMLYIDDIGIH
jgi:hypothetical protein